jgi:hypothetical protein
MAKKSGRSASKSASLLAERRTHPIDDEFAVFLDGVARVLPFG